jgi:hypothetical protein
MDDSALSARIPITFPMLERREATYDADGDVMFFKFNV